MAFCSNCGHKLKMGAKFCPECGVKVDDDQQNEDQSNKVVQGKVHKCPNCGEIVKAFTTKCPLCGFEFRGVQASSAVKEFEKQFKEIESRRKEKSVLAKVATTLGIKQNDPVDDQLVNLIRNYPIPNTKEDVLEFMILASSNINSDVYGLKWTLDYNYRKNNTAERKISDAWIAKTNQIYQKAQLSLVNEPEFLQIQNMYNSKMREVQKSKRKILWLIFGYLAFMAILIIMILLL